MKRLLHLILILNLLGLGPWACITPVIPLPPPSPESYSLELSADKNEIVIRGRAEADSLIFMFNQRTGKGTISRAGADGVFATEPMAVRDQDQLNIWSARGTDEIESDVTCAVFDLATLRLQAGCQ